MSNDHRKLKAFDLADALVLEVYHATRSFPKDELYGITSQLRRAAVSVPANIVEGCGRTTRREYRQFLSVAFASLREVGYLLGLASRLGYLVEDDSNRLASRHEEASRVLAALMKSLS
ncbi:MAG: four helix bundle protein [Acidobacteria bacterium]|nr:four helix bundle protein [Acidobacteriota bacterium]